MNHIEQVCLRQVNIIREACGSLPLLELRKPNPRDGRNTIGVSIRDGAVKSVGVGTNIIDLSIPYEPARKSALIKMVAAGLMAWGDKQSISVKTPDEIARYIRIVDGGE